MEIVPNTTGNHNEFLRHFLLSETVKSPQEILQVFRETTPQLPPEEFLHRLPGEGTAIQFFDDSEDKDRRKAYCTFTFSGQLAERKQKRGCGVYFSANSFEGHRRKENVKHLRAFFLDWDGAKQGDGTSRETIDARKVTMLRRLLFHEDTFIPHVIIETFHGLHCLWLIKIDSTLTLSLWERFEAFLVEHFGGDQGAKDVTRVLRLPPYAHLKDPNNPFPVRFLYLDLP